MTHSRNPVVLTIGNFDGVHLGHQALIQRCIQLANSRQSKSVALTFDPLPRELFNAQDAPTRLQSLADRRETLLGYGLDEVVVLPFSTKLSQLSPSQFVNQLLTERFQLAELVVGWDFRFGRGRAGDVNTLRQLLSIPVHQIEAHYFNTQVVSSTRVRAAISSGQLHQCHQLLNRPHAIYGQVRRGHQRGRRIGFPTANLHAIEGAIPKSGVYLIQAILSNREVHNGVVNIGVNPTFNNAVQSIEAHLFDFDKDLYGQPLRLLFIARLRDERRFASIDALKAQIALDVERAQAILGG